MADQQQQHYHPYHKALESMIVDDDLEMLLKRPQFMSDFHCALSAILTSPMMKMLPIELIAPAFIGLVICGLRNNFEAEALQILTPEEQEKSRRLLESIFPEEEHRGNSNTPETDIDPDSQLLG